MARDMKKKAELDRISHNKIYMQKGIKIRRDSHIPEALELMTEKTGTSVNSYIVSCLRDKLIQDGYLQE